MYSSKSIFCIFATLFLIVQSTPLENTEGEKEAGVKVNPVSVPLYRYWNSQIGDHFYTININELGQHGKNGYVAEGVAGRCYSSHEPGTVAFLRYYNAGANGDHFYTTNINELGPNGKNGYVAEGVACYVFVHPSPGIVAFYRYYNSAINDHFYTTNVNELGPHGSKGYVSEGIAAYIFPA